MITVHPGHRTVYVHASEPKGGEGKVRVLGRVQATVRVTVSTQVRAVYTQLGHAHLDWA